MNALSVNKLLPLDMLGEVLIRAADYGTEVERILNLDGGGNRPMPLAPCGAFPREARSELAQLSASRLFPHARAPEAAMSGMFLYFSCLDEAHRIAQDIPGSEGSYWHAIMHRQEPDPGNAAYWFRSVGRHAIFPALREEAAAAGFDSGAAWDPFRFIDYFEAARSRPGSEEERIAMQVQLSEWQLLFDYCARRPSGE
jgi:hypothetical protein